jgi:uncharacterized protein YodC (DUF2158 family)
MSFEPGDVVFLKSGGQPMTVVGKTEQDIECMWMGEEGDLFREAIPSIALSTYEDLDLDDDEDEDEEETDNKADNNKSAT